MSLWTCVPPSWAWQECNRLLRLGRPHVAQLRCPNDVSGDIGGCSARRALKPKFYQHTQTMVTAGILPFRENSHGRAGNRTRDLMISSQRLWPLDHEAGLIFSVLSSSALCSLSLAVCYGFVSSRTKICLGFSFLLSWQEYLLSWGLLLCVQPLTVKILSSPSSLCVWLHCTTVWASFSFR